MSRDPLMCECWSHMGRPRQDGKACKSKTVWIFTICISLWKWGSVFYCKVVDGSQVLFFNRFCVPGRSLSMGWLNTHTSWNSSLDNFPLLVYFPGKAAISIVIPINSNKYHIFGRNSYSYSKTNILEYQRLIMFNCLIVILYRQHTKLILYQHHWILSIDVD